MSAPTASGRCVCGALRYETSGPLRGVIVCHCVECRRYHGTSGAYSAATAQRPRDRRPRGRRCAGFPAPRASRAASADSAAAAARACSGASPERTTVSIAAGTLDGATGLRIIQHIWDEQRADWELEDDLPRLPRGS